MEIGDIGGISTLVLILVLSFAIDRFTNAALFLLSFVKRWADWAPDPLTVGRPAIRATGKHLHIAPPRYYMDGARS